MAFAAVAAVVFSPDSHGQAAVSDGGTPSYSMEIPVPPGIAGMKPNLALTYTGSPVNGPLGYGWTIQGVSAITRCGYIPAIDGYIHGVNLGPNDKLCLDGQRLIQTDSNGNVVNGSASSFTTAQPFQQGDSLGTTASGAYTEYRTEKNMFARIRAYGAAGGVPANGPAYFVVWTKAGQIFEYGNDSNTTANANIQPTNQSVVTAWNVSRIRDTLGNYIDFQYTQRDLASGSGPALGPTQGHEWLLGEIRYTGNGFQVPTNKVVFTYADRPTTPMADRSENYHLGNKNVSVALLQGVRTYVNWPASQSTQPPNAVEARYIKLAYSQGSVAQRSRLSSIAECSGANEAVCMPATTFGYAPGGADAYQANSAFAASSLSTLPMVSSSGTAMGVLVGDFNGDGLMDILRYSDTPTQNELWLNTGNGSFRQVTSFGASSSADFLTTSDGCYTAYAVDMNGDGLTDILRIHQTTNNNHVACAAGNSAIYLANGDGTFAAPQVLPSNIDFTQALANGSTSNGCESSKSTCPVLYSQTQGANWYLIDLNGDGLLDIVTTISPAYLQMSPKPGPNYGCGVCTHVYIQSPPGTFNELTTTNVAGVSLYGPNGMNPHLPNLLARAYVADVNGDGLSDLWVNSGLWLSNGDGNFTLASSSSMSGACATPLDFNGDGRQDCLWSVPTTVENPNSFLNVSDGLTWGAIVGSFNLGNSATGTVISDTGIGSVQLDINGDGRTDILRWGDDPTKNTLFLSNGDGSFTASRTFSLGGTVQLKKSDGSYDFYAGDFTGHGNVEFLRVVANVSSGASGTNQLYTKVDPTPPDILSSVTSGTGLTTTFTWVPLTDSSSGALGARYVSGRLTTPAVYPQVDVMFPMWVVATSTDATGVGSSTVATEYWYSGLTSAYDGRGIQGFREVRRQSPGPNGNPLTVDTQYIPTYPYTGVASQTETWSGVLTAPPSALISRTTNVYCEASVAANAASASSGAPCATTAKVQVPFLYSTLEEGWDLSTAAALPTVKTVNTFDATGNPLTVDVKTTGIVFGQSQTFDRLTTNSYYPDATSGNQWILGRLQTATQTNTVPNSLASITTSAGSGAFASATHGAVESATLSVPVFANTELGTTNSATATLTNTGGAALAVSPVPSSASVAGTDFSFVSTTCGSSVAAGASCGITVQFSPSAAVARTGLLSVQTNVGTQSAALSAQGLTQAALAVSGCVAASSITPTAATLTCTLGNSGQSAAASVVYATSLASVTGPASCAAGTSNCGTVTVKSPTAAGAYSGTVTATPNLGSAGSASFSGLTVLTQAQPALTSCSWTINATTPTPDVLTCTLGNSGQTAIAGVTYSSTLSGATINGPTGSCAAGTVNCGTVTLTSPTAAGTYAGTLTATASNGNQASTSFSGMTVWTQPALALTGCSGAPSDSPAGATYRCSLINNGQATAANIGYSSSLSGSSVSGPTGSCVGNGANCGTATLTTPGSVGSYSGTLTATPSLGTGASASFSGLTVLTPVVFTVASPVNTGGGTYTWTFTNPNVGAITVQAVKSYTSNSEDYPGVGGTCAANAVVAAGGTCTVVLSALPDCKLYKVYPEVDTAAGATVGNVEGVPPSAGACE